MKVARGIQVLVSLIAISAMGCGGDLSRFKDRSVQQAPVNDDEVGIVVVDASTESIEEFLERYPEATFRPLLLGSSSTIVEFFGVAEDVVKDEFSEAETFKNKVQRFVQPEPKDYYKIAKNLIEKPTMTKPKFGRSLDTTTSPTSANQADDELDPSTCKRHPFFGPQAFISRIGSAMKKANGKDYSPVGSDIKLSSVNSTPSPDVPRPLKQLWLLLPPEGSLYEASVVSTLEVSLTPDMVGLFEIILIVQDSEGYCDANRIDFLIAENPELVPIPSSTMNFTMDINLFPHASDLNLSITRKVSTGAGKVIAVIDTGVNYNHPGIRSNILINEADPVNGKDDDNNGIIDDHLGYDFAHGDRFPFDDMGHGTMVAGMAASPWIGVAPDAKILAIKSSHKHGTDFGTLTAAVRYAIDRGADVINLSMGTHSRPPKALEEEITRAEKLGIVVVAAAGNGDAVGEGINTDKIPHYPSSFEIDNIISVAARDHVGLIAKYSNYGAASVDVVTVGGTPENPVKSIYVPNPSGKVFVETVGTSFAAPVVSGIVAAILEKAPDLTPLQVKELLMQSGREEEYLKERVGSGRVLSLEEALVKAIFPLALGM